MIYPKLLAVEPLDNYHLMLAYANKEKRIYDFKPNLNHPFFKELSNAELRLLWLTANWNG